MKLTKEEEADFTRWHLQHIPAILDKAVRIRTARRGHKYICHLIVEVLLPIFEKEIEEIRREEI